jgi:DNA-binding XRE family transcriptional regulator
MRKLYSIIFCLAAALPLLVASCSHSDPRTQALIDLRSELEDQLDDLNAGDWILIGPGASLEKALTAEDIRHISVLATNVSVLRQTLDLMERDDRLGPRLWVCRELEQRTNRNPGTARMRAHLKELLAGRTHFSVDERIIQLQIKMLEPQRKLLFIRTETIIPHSYIGIELDYADSTSAPATPASTSKPVYRHAELKP